MRATLTKQPHYLYTIEMQMSRVHKNNLAYGANYRRQPQKAGHWCTNRIASPCMGSSATSFRCDTGACIAWGRPGHDQQGRSAMIQQYHITPCWNLCTRLTHVNTSRVREDQFLILPPSPQT